MLIKIVTCHEVYNHGASLQEYALLHHLNSLGHSAEAVNFKPWYLRNNFSLTSVAQKFDRPFVKQMYILAKFPFKYKMLRRKKAFDLFSQKYTPSGKQVFFSNDDLKKNVPAADAYICGSDQIWNSYFQNGKDPAFYLNFVPNDKLKLSYAASFAIDHLEDGIKPLVKENLANFDFISVRETSGVKILNDLGFQNVVQVFDPVFLLCRDHWNNFTIEIPEKFLFIYDFDSNPLVKKIALHLKKEKGYKIYTVNHNVRYADKNFFTKGPEFFVSLVKNADLIITNSFHALTFSLIFNKEFVVVNRNVEINTRMRDLLQLIKVDRLIQSFDEFLEIQPIVYSEVNLLLDEKISLSKEFLNDALNTDRSTVCL